MSKLYKPRLYNRDLPDWRESETAFCGIHQRKYRPWMLVDGKWVQKGCWRCKNEIAARSLRHG